MKKILCLLIFLAGCASAPEKKLLNLPYDKWSELKQNASKGLFLSEKDTSLEFKVANILLEANYLIKTNKNELACKKFQELYLLNLNPLKDHLLLNIFDYCSLSKSDYVAYFKQHKPETYAKELYAEKAYLISVNNNLKFYTAYFGLELSKYKKTPNEKMQLLTKAKEIAKELEDKTLLNEVESRIIEVAPRFETRITKENKLKIAKDFEVSRQFQKARDLYYEIINSDQFSDEEKYKTYNQLRNSFKVERKLSEFLNKSFEMENFFKEKAIQENQKTKELWIDSKIALSRAIWTENKREEAILQLEEILSSNAPTINQRAQALWLIGSIKIEEKKNVEALTFYEKAADLKVTDTKLNEDIDWSLIWNYFLLKKYNLVIKNVPKFARPSLNPMFYNKLYFWKAKSEKHLKKKDIAEKSFQSILENDPFSYYGILSAMELNKELSPLHFDSSKLNFTTSNDSTLDWLIQLESIKLAQKYLKEINSKFKTINEREFAMSLYRQTKWYQGAMSQVSNFPLKQRAQVTENNYDVIFPTPFIDLINDAALKMNVPNELILSIMRQESSFIPTERSWVDAFGLMQLIPERASTLAKKYKINYSKVDDLYDPAINIQLGTALLSELINQYQAKFAQTVAAYNASPSAIKNWEKERFNGDYLEFIEMIPYEETRNYIKLVFRNFITYKRILNATPVLIGPNFFEVPFSHNH